MLETSSDVLNIVLAVSVFGLSFMLCWGLYYLVMIFRQLFKTVQEFKAKIDRVEASIISFKEKIESSTSYLLLIGEGVKKLVDIMKHKEREKDIDDEK